MDFKMYHYRSLNILLIILFTGFVVMDVFPNKQSSKENEIKKLINTGKKYYERGEYSEALVQFLEAKDLIEEMGPKEQISFLDEMSEIYFNLALTYYAARDNERNREQCQEYLNLWLEKNPNKKIDELSYPKGFVEIFRQIRNKTQKPEEKVKLPVEKPEVKKPAAKTEQKKTGEKEKTTERKEKITPEKKPIIRKKAGEAEQPANKKKPPWLVIGGAVVAAGTVAAVLFLGGPSTGTIQVNSTPSGARVYLNGSDTGQVTNCTLSNIEKGSHTIKLVKEGYGDYQKSVTLKKGQTETVNADLTANTITVTSPSEGEMWFTGDEVEIKWNTGGGINLSRSEETIQTTVQSDSGIDILHYDSMRRMMKDIRFFSLSNQAHVFLEGDARTKNFMISKRTSSSFFSTAIKPPMHNRPNSILAHRHMMDNILLPEQVINRDRMQNSGKENLLLQTRNNSRQNIESDQPLAISNVIIELYLDSSLVKTISSSTPNDGSHTWTVPNDLTEAMNYKVRISCAVENEVYGESVEFEVIDITNKFHWVEVPAGWFKMGDNYNEGESDEKPVHNVYLNGYYVSKYEVTFEQYDIFCDATGRTKPDDEGWGRGQRPVIYVSWHDAKAFCDWLSDITGKDIHLTTEAQWEKAARGTDQRRYPWGNSDPNCDKANYYGCKSKTMPVGTYNGGVSPYGAYDMAGNVFEWCLDWYGSDYYSYSPSHNPQGPSSGSGRVRRGGSWNGNTDYLRSADRSVSSPPTCIRNYIGFRLCMEK
ncbi:MAG: SUMF1/EgtB/PvdO family nonheme iron enzyme [Candidatus Aminicenantes bacterium]|nr:SUMF1/EgtB/PvdO family nonheme iron enzyme [Candidatus Aminicenantes bacterium]